MNTPEWHLSPDSAGPHMALAFKSGKDFKYFWEKNSKTSGNDNRSTTPWTIPPTSRIPSQERVRTLFISSLEQKGCVSATTHSFFLSFFPPFSTTPCEFVAQALLCFLITHRSFPIKKGVWYEPKKPQLTYGWLGVGNSSKLGYGLLAPSRVGKSAFYFTAGCVDLRSWVIKKESSRL